MAEEKRHFEFPSRQVAVGSEARVAIALEFIAYYLDRIEGHLGKLVEVVDANGGGFPILQEELARIRKAIEVHK